jgi:hypothetical protein
LKIFEILRKQFCHDLKKHSSVFRAVVVITQVSIEHGSPLYSVAYFNQVATDIEKSNVKNGLRNLLSSDFIRIVIKQ